MKKSTLFILPILALLLNSCGYNTMVELQQATNKQWGNVQSAYQRRADLIPNIVNTVKGEAKFEQQTLTDVANARAKATSITLDPTNLTPEKLQEFQQAQGQLAMAIGRLMSVTENYPNLQANASFKELQAQLEGTENRINVERDKFNEEVGKYNTYIKSVPQSLYAGWFKFTEKAYFEADKAAATAPVVSFDSTK